MTCYDDMSLLVCNCYRVDEIFLILIFFENEFCVLRFKSIEMRHVFIKITIYNKHLDIQVTFVVIRQEHMVVEPM